MMGEVAWPFWSKDVELTAEVNRYKLNICKEASPVFRARDADTETYTAQGTLAGRRRFGHTGRTISRRRTRLYGSSTARIGNELTIVDKNWRGCSCKR